MMSPLRGYSNPLMFIPKFHIRTPTSFSGNVLLSLSYFLALWLKSADYDDYADCSHAPVRQV
jgi:hypothetical protein